MIQCVWYKSFIVCTRLYTLILTGNNNLLFAIWLSGYQYKTAWAAVLKRRFYNVTIALTG